MSRDEGEMCRHEGCEKRFYGQKERGEHEKSAHQGHRLNCDHCEKSYSAKTSLMRHMLLEHDVLVKCAECGKSFDDFDTYLIHRRKKSKCKKSHKFGFSRKSFKRNVVRLGEPDPKFKSVLNTLSGKSKCLFCGQITLNKNMARHMRERHNSTSPSQPKQLDYKWHLIEAGIEPDPAKCPICEKKFKNVRSLPSHMKTAHGK